MASQDWTRVVNTTIANFIKGEEPNVLRTRKLPAMLKSRGRFSFGYSGDYLDWKVRYKRAPLSGYADTETLIFPRRERHKTAQLPWRAYSATDSMTKFEKLKNRGAQQIIDVYGNTAKWLLEDATEVFSEEIYKDGNLAANSKGFHGIESFLGGVTPGDKFIAVNNDTFAGISTVLGAHGGAWEGDWPSGRGSAEFDFWTPLLVDYTDTEWEAAEDNWANNCIESLRFGIIKSQKNKASTGKLDLIMTEGELYRQFLNSLDDKERIQVTASTKSSELIKLGFTDVQNFDGVDITWEFGMPVNTAYGFNIDQMEVKSMQKQLFVPDGPDWDISTRSWRFALDAMGNICWNPPYFVKWFPYTN